MREALGPYRASLTQGRRRSIIFLFILAVGITGAIAWSSFVPLQDQRKLLSRFETGNVTPENFFEFAPGVTCFGGEFGGPPPVVEPQGSAPSGATTAPTETPPQPIAECQFVAPDGQPLGPRFQGDPFQKFSNGLVSRQFIDEVRPAIVESLRTQIDDAEQFLGVRALFQVRVRVVGTFVGILFAVLFASTFMGAELRWSVWRTLLTHEPRRGKMIASKFGAMWTFVLFGFVMALIVSTGVDVVMRNLLEVHANVAGPSVLRLAKEAGWATLSLGLYSTIASALTLAVRTSLAGLFSLLLFLGDFLLVQRYTRLRSFLPVQNISWLLPQPTTVTSGYVWPPAITTKFECVRKAGTAFRECKEVMLKPIPHWRAALVLGAWIIGFAFAAWAVFRSRDVPQ